MSSGIVGNGEACHSMDILMIKNKIVPRYLEGY